jgi:arylsulfatase A-like enzyme
MADIALVVLDTLRKDAFDEHFGWLPGRRFENAYSTANWTIPAHASLFTGMYASEIGVHAKHTSLDCEEITLAERLRERGYETRAFSANTNVTGHFDFDRGFSDFRSPKRFEHLNDDSLFDWRSFNRGTTRTGLGKYVKAVVDCVRSDADTVPSLIAGVRSVLRSGGSGVEYGGTKEAIKEVETMSRTDDEFLFLNLMEAHEPYRVPPEYANTDGVDLTQAVGDITLGTFDAADVQTAYDDCARYLSDIYAELFDRLKSRYDYIITLSDHGEMLGEYSAWGHEHGVYPQLTHIPLVISGPDLSGEVEQPVSILDVHKTILDLAGIKTDDGDGESLIGELPKREYLTEYLGLTSWSEQKLDELARAGERERYDRKLRGYISTSGSYGFETVGGIETDGQLEDETVQDALSCLVSELDVRKVTVDNEVPEEVKEQLSDLGYA